MASIDKEFAATTERAKAAMDDGEYRAAARMLRELAQAIGEHAERFEDWQKDAKRMGGDHELS